MRLIDVARIASGIANIASGREIAAAVPLLQHALDTMTAMVKEQAQEHGFLLDVRQVGDMAGLHSAGALEALRAATSLLTDAKMPPRFCAKILRIEETLQASPPNMGAARVRLEELIHDVIAHLTEPMFLEVAPERRDLYIQPEPPFGTRVEAAFPTAHRDIAAAARCLALDEWTACVFHLMRVLEHGLRVVADRFNVPFETDSWHKVLTGIERGIEARRSRGSLTEQDRTEISKYSEAAIQFRYFKDAWRNHVSHGREHYDEREAEVVYTHVRDFMQLLSGFAAVPGTSGTS